MYRPRSTLCVPDNACSLAMISTVMVVLSESKTLFSCVMIMSENVDVEEEFTLASIVSESEVLSISSILKTQLTFPHHLESEF